jgi:endonuclease-3 related protein
VTPAGSFRPRYSARCSRGRLTPRERFEIAVGAILTQNTAWTHVEKALEPLHRSRLMDPRRMLRAPLPRLYRLIRSSGYFRQKARRLKNFCGFLDRRWKGRLDLFLDRPTELVRGELLALNGIGPETADSLLLYAGRHARFVVDAYTRRFGRRFGLFRTEDYHKVQKFFMDRLPPSPYDFREYHALLVELGKRHCRATPSCKGCPVRARCATGRRRLHG